MPNLESCTQWNVESNHIGFWNKCGQPVVVLFMQLDRHRPIKREIKPNARFDTGRTQAQLHATGWMSTRCPVGFVPSVPLRFENREAIIASKYTCVKK